jgi:hypothetical protein
MRALARPRPAAIGHRPSPHLLALLARLRLRPRRRDLIDLADR